MMFVCRIISADIISQYMYQWTGSTRGNNCTMFLLDELAQGVIDYQIDENNLDYDANSRCDQGVYFLG